MLRGVSRSVTSIARNNNSYYYNKNIFQQNNKITLPFSPSPSPLNTHTIGIKKYHQQRFYENNNNNHKNNNGNNKNNENKYDYQEQIYKIRLFNTIGGLVGITFAVQCLHCEENNTNNNNFNNHNHNNTQNILKEQEVEQIIQSIAQQENNGSGNNINNEETVKADISKFWREVFLPDLPLILLSILATVASTVIGLKLPGLFGELVDKARSGAVITHTDVFKALGVLVLQGVVQFGYITLVSFAAERMVSRLKNKLFSIVLSQDIEFFDNGDLLSRLTADPESIRAAFKHTVTLGVKSIGQIVGGVAQLYFISKDLTMLMLIIVPGVVGIGTLYTRFLKKVSLKARNAAAQASFVATEVISMKAFTGETFEKKRFSEKIKDSLHLSERMGVFLGVLQGLSTVALQGIGLVVYWYGGIKVSQGQLTTGALTSFMLHTSFLQSSLQHLSMLMGQVVGAFGSASRIVEIVEISPKINRKPHNNARPSVRLPSVKGVIELRNVNFSYPTRENHQVLQDFSLTLQPGKVLALAGPSGSGKSTISTLLQRFYDPNGGSVMLDGVPLTVLDPYWLRDLIGVVSQEPILFATSILENIAYGKPGATQDEIMEAAKKAHAHHFINSFPQGYNTVVGERGVQLSGGQRQRIAIARAILKNPRILILDEATSALDAESEWQVQEALTQLMKGRTVLVIAHRLSTVQNADTIAVVVGGQIVEMGKHSELMQKGGVYSNLVIKQMQ